MLDRLTDEPLDVMVNGKLIAKGEVVAEGNRFGLRILELVGGSSVPASKAQA
jgi:flagellar motor switch protein FliN/FliY